MDVKKAADKLLAGEVVAIPTETVYGLAAIVSSETALKKIFTVKQRPLFDPLIVHVLDSDQARTLAAQWPKEIAALTEAFWPGPLTVVVPKNAKVSSLISAGLETVGLRAPNHELARQVIQLTGPLAAPSANRFGRTSPTRADHVRVEFSNQVPVLDGGPCQVGVESAVVRWNEERQHLELLRPGSIDQTAIGAILKKVNSRASIVRISSQASPGHTEHHYQPRLPLVIAQGPASEPARAQIAQILNLTSQTLFDLILSREPTLAARELYHRLHELSQNPQGAIIYWQGSEWQDPRWEALRDRLERAASHRL